MVWRRVLLVLPYCLKRCSCLFWRSIFEPFFLLVCYFYLCQPACRQPWRAYPFCLIFLRVILICSVFSREPVQQSVAGWVRP